MFIKETSVRSEGRMSLMLQSVYPKKWIVCISPNEQNETDIYKFDTLDDALLFYNEKEQKLIDYEKEVINGKPQ